MTKEERFDRLEQLANEMLELVAEMRADNEEDKNLPVPVLRVVPALRKSPARARYAPADIRIDDTDIIRLLEPNNPKQLGSKTRLIYDQYQDRLPVGVWKKKIAHLPRGHEWRAHLRWDIAKAYIRIEAA